MENTTLLFKQDWVSGYTQCTLVVGAQYDQRGPKCTPSLKSRKSSRNQYDGLQSYVEDTPGKSQPGDCKRSLELEQWSEPGVVEFRMVMDEGKSIRDRLEKIEVVPAGRREQRLEVRLLSEGLEAG